jgi:hypothetical protein
MFTIRMSASDNGRIRISSMQGNPYNDVQGPRLAGLPGEKFKVNVP